jgi:hypothetical protein
LGKQTAQEFVHRVEHLQHCILGLDFRVQNLGFEIFFLNFFHTKLNPTFFQVGKSNFLFVPNSHAENERKKKAYFC